MPALRIAALSEDIERNAPVLAPLIRSVLPEYYGLLCPDAAQAEYIIVRQLKMLSEVNAGFVAIAGDTPVGVICIYPIAEGEIRQMAGLLRGVPAEMRGAALTALQQHAREIAPLPESGLYVSRLAVAPEWRGRGLGRRLFAAAEEAARAGDHTCVALHVHRANHLARSFYETLGFHSLPAGGAAYLVMQRTLSPPGGTAVDSPP